MLRNMSARCRISHIHFSVIFLIFFILAITTMSSVRAVCSILLVAAVSVVASDLGDICLIQCPEGEIMNDHEKLVTIDGAKESCKTWAFKALGGQLKSISENVKCESIQKTFPTECCGGNSRRAGYADHEEF
jgi:hypothetical protein